MHKKYIVHRRFRSNTVSGAVNLPVGTECERVGDVICYQGKPVCAIRSEAACQYFACNDDGQGLLRGELTRSIQKRLAETNGRGDAEHQARWDCVWDDAVCQRYKRTDYTDYWLWGEQFFHADIEDLEHIARLVGVPKYTKGG